MHADTHLRYVSVAALIVSPDRKKLLICKRSDSDSYEPCSVVFPSGRVEGKELLKERLLAEIREEVGVQIDEESTVYIGECVFLRDGLPVNQVCFGVRATNTAIRPDSKELKSIRWVMPVEFRREFGPTGYVAGLFGFVRRAEEMGLLV